MPPEEIVGLVDFRYLTDALTPDEALEILEKAVPGREERAERAAGRGLPRLHHDPGLAGLLRREDGPARPRGGGGRLHPDQAEGRRPTSPTTSDVCRWRGRAVGPDIKIAVDANQHWDVGEAIDWVRQLQEFDIAWIEEPTSPDDLLGHATIRRALAPTPVATGEHTANRVMFKQLLQLEAIDVMQIDAARVAGVNENIANLLLAAKFGVRVCPHAGGVGLCEAVQHLSMIDLRRGQRDRRQDRYIEYVDHLHEHFVDPVRIVRRPLPRAAGARGPAPR